MPDQHSTNYINNKKSELIREITAQIMEIESRIEKKITGKWSPSNSMDIKELQEAKEKLSNIKYHLLNGCKLSMDNKTLEQQASLALLDGQISRVDKILGNIFCDRKIILGPLSFKKLDEEYKNKYNNQSFDTYKGYRIEVDEQELWKVAIILEFKVSEFGGLT
jgi:hypothetical protein